MMILVMIIAVWTWRATVRMMIAAEAVSAMIVSIAVVWMIPTAVVVVRTAAAVALAMIGE